MAQSLQSARVVPVFRLQAPVLLALAIAILRWVFPERPADLQGPRALADLVFALGLWGLLISIAGGLGLKVLRRIGAERLSQVELEAFGLPLGLGIYAYGVMSLGLAGWLRPPALLVWSGLALLMAWREIGEIWEGIPTWMVRLARTWRALEAGEKIFAMAGGLIFSLTLLQALTPPWDYDALMYHLQGPRLFLQAGRFLLLPENWQANFPFTIEMLFTVGLAYGSETFAKLVHLSCAAALVLATYACGKRFLGPGGGKYAAIVLLGIPAIPLWASWANIDIGWALFEFLGVYAFLLWIESNRRCWLVLSGVFAGLALGSKYLALAEVFVLGLMTLWYGKRSGFKSALSSGLLFGSVSLLVGSPWYLKNWILGHNPVYPLFFGGTGWPDERLGWLMAYLNSFGAGREIWDYLLLPWNLYAQPERFATFRNILELSPLFPLALLYLGMRKSSIVNAIAILALLRFALWSAGSQQTRMLLPVFPLLSLLTAHVFLQLVSRTRIQTMFWSKFRRFAVYGCAGGTLAISLFLSALNTVYLRPVPVLFGLESKAEFLRRIVHDYAAIEYIHTHLPDPARVLMMWDGQGYYCDERCLPSTEHSRWSQMAASTPNVLSLSAGLRAQGITHLLFSLNDVDLLWQHDPTEKHHWATTFFLEEFRPACTKEVYTDGKVSLFQLTCPRMSVTDHR